MCGIVAVWNRDGAPVDLAALARSVTAMRRRGPDDEGYVLVDTRTGRFLACRGPGTDPRVDLPPLAAAAGQPFDLALGHRRLSIVDLSPAGHQPMAARDGALWIVFNGLVHNFLEVRRELEGRGHRFRTGTDTEVVLHAYDEWGSGCVARFNGMWAFVIWDGRRRQLFASRDRLGIKPLLAAEVGPVAALASELRALAPLPRVPAEIDPEAVHHYLSLMQVPAPLTIYRAIRKTRPGHSVTVTRDAVDEAAYWRVEPDVVPIPEGEALERLDGLLADSIRLRLIADVPMGALLSGGVDSGVVTALAAGARRPQPFETFCLGFPDEPDVDESAWAAEVAGHVGATHHSVRLSPAFLRNLPALVERLDEPFAVSSALGVVRLAEAATARGCKVLLTGDGGDELFAGYPRRHAAVDHQWDAIDARRLSRLRSQRAQAVAGPAAWRPVSLATRVGRRLRGLTLSSRRGRDLAFNASRMLVSDADKRALYAPAWADRVRGASTLAWLCATLPGVDADRLARWQVHDVRTSLPDEMLAKVDRATMAAAVEARPPLLDHRLVELAVSLPASLKLRAGETKWIWKRLGERYLPSSVMSRPKGGFTMPLTRWFAHEWRDLLGDALGARAIARTGVFRPAAVDGVLAHHAAQPDFTTAHLVFALLCFQLWHDGVHRARVGTP